MLSPSYAPLLNPFVSVFLSVQDSGWSFSSGIVSDSGAFHLKFPKRYSSGEWNRIFLNFPERG